MNAVAISVFIGLFSVITVLGVVSANWRRGDLTHLHEWGLGGRQFGAWITWFLIGGDLYTAYTFIAVPALVFGAGALGFFALPYTVLVYPMVYFLLPRLWTVAQERNCVTAADVVVSRFGSPGLALAVAVTGIVATLPYIALQLVGIQVVIAGLGFPTHGPLAELPLFVAFGILATFTYVSGLRAPASIAVVKDLLVYVTVAAMIVVIPLRLGGFARIFSMVPEKLLLLPHGGGGNIGEAPYYGSLALGSAMALMFYPHATTAVLAAKGPDTLRRNCVFLPAYSFILGLIALLGFVARAARVDKDPALVSYFGAYKSQFAIPGLLLHYFPAWFVGVGFAAIAIGALVPAAIMSIAAANLFTRNIYKTYVHPSCSPAHETMIAKGASLVVKFGALAFVMYMPLTYAIQFQLLGGILILQTLPAIVFGVYTNWFSAKSLLGGWAVGIAWSAWAGSLSGFTSPMYVMHVGRSSISVYIGILALMLNLVTCLFVGGASRAASPVKRPPGTAIDSNA